MPSATPSPATQTFGRAMQAHFPLAPDVTYLNHGTVGVVPKRVLAAKIALLEEMERAPSTFMLRELSGDMPAPWRPGPTRMREAAGKVASFVGARGEDFVFAPNVTTALNAVLRSFPLGPGEEILTTDLAYGAITNAACYRARETGAVVNVITMPYPITPAAARDAIVGAAGPRTRLAIVDHITSESALVLPLAEIAAALKARGIAVLADGAHAPGAIDVDVPSLGVDWYGANLHKWCHAPRSCGFLWAPRERQEGLHPSTISWGLDAEFTSRFDWVGTLDPTNYLAAPEGIALLREWNFAAARDYMHRLAWDGARLLAGRWDVPLGMPEEMVGTMATVPLPERAGKTREDAERLRLALLVEDKIEIQLHAFRGRLWVRLSAQVYNDLEDVERLAEAVVRRG
jgi:isopenicillin-N epimerase